MEEALEETTWVIPGEILGKFSGVMLVIVLEQFQKNTERVPRWRNPEIFLAVILIFFGGILEKYLEEEPF